MTKLYISLFCVLALVGSVAFTYYAGYQRGYASHTAEVQAAAVGVVLEGKDIVVEALKAGAEVSGKIEGVIKNDEDCARVLNFNLDKCML